MTTANQNRINQLKREIATLRKAEAQETRKEADIQARINRANEAASRTKSIPTIRSKLKEVERGRRNLADVQKKRAQISGKIAEKSKRLHSYEERLIRERKEYERSITNEIQRRVNLSSVSFPTHHARETYDFFISHAGEDKDSFVRELTKMLQAKGAKVWYDEFTLKVGDSLRRQIDRGLTNSRFGVVVLSKHFFRKEGALKELDGLLSLEIDGTTRILPIWHEISRDEIARHSAILLDKVALSTTLSSTSEIADKLCELID